MSSEPTIVIVGAGIVGRQLVAALLLKDHPADAVRIFASEHSEAEELEFGDDVLTVEKMGPDSFRGAKVVILAVPASAARTIAQTAQQQGLWVIDLSGAFRLDASIPLVVPGVNDGVLDRPFTGKVVAMASPATQAVSLALTPLREKFGLVFTDVTVLVGAAVAGDAGVERLSKQSADLMNGKDPDVETFPHRLGFNVIPAVGAIDGRGLAESERVLLVELARLWAADLPAVTTTSALVPTYHSLTLFISAQLRRPVDVEGVRAVLRAETNLKVLDDPETNVYPMPMLTTDDAAVHVGRIRAIAERVQLVASVDAAFRMAETAVELALELSER